MQIRNKERGLFHNKQGRADVIYIRCLSQIKKCVRCMSKVENKDINQPDQKQIFKRLLLKGFTLSLLIILLVSTMECCATSYKHKRIKSTPCPCETRYKR
jgi:hypothetical protein